MLTVRHYTIPIFIPELACPFQCVFCNQKKISGQHHHPSGDEIIETIENHLRTFKAKRKYVEVGFFGGSFTGISVEEQKRYLKYVQPYIRLEQIQSVRLSTRPDYITKDILKMLKNYNVTTIELGAQSFDDEVLKKTRRGHSSKHIIEAAALIKKYGFKLGLQMMIGLPGDTLEKSLNTAKKIVSAGADNTRIYPAVVIRDTQMHTWYKQGSYMPLDLKDAIDWTKKLLPIFEKGGVNVIRVGLHPSEGLINGEEMIAGPFHSSFKELVMTQIWKELLGSIAKKHKSKSVEIHVPKKELNYAIGHKSQNKKMLMSELKSVKFVASEDLPSRTFKIH